MNTVFKLYYQAWLLFAVGGSGLLFWLFRRLSRPDPGDRTLSPRRRRGRRLGLGAVALVLLAMALFPFKATLLRTNAFGNQPTLDGMAWMERSQPDDAAAAAWLRQHGAAAAGQRAPVVLEASGGPYSQFARIATQTGFPTVLGWDQHERLWRGAAIENEVTARQRDIDAIYTAATADAARPLLDKYGVTYVVVGYLERQKYGANPGGLAKFDGPPFQPVFRQGQTAVYRVAGGP
jgi:uncharacterized membrane protein